jgi:hypothetical protein
VPGADQFFRRVGTGVGLPWWRRLLWLRLVLRLRRRLGLVLRLRLILRLSRRLPLILRLSLVLGLRLILRLRLLLRRGRYHPKRHRSERNRCKAQGEGHESPLEVKVVAAALTEC